MHYSYHNRIKQRIENDELIGFDFVEDYKTKSGELLDITLVLKFKTEPQERFVRERSFDKYDWLLN